MLHLSHKTKTYTRGLSLVELLIAISVLGILALSLGMLTATVHSSNEFAIAHGETLQHACVACQRIEQNCRRSYATADYPGFWVVSTSIESHRFPDALVIWCPPKGTPANADGPPLLNELVLYTYDKSAPQRLLEITVPKASSNVPAISNAKLWNSIVAAAQASDTVDKNQLTDLLRVGKSGNTGNDWRGVIRFETRYHPTASQWSNFEAGNMAWEKMVWPLGRYSADFGVRQSLCCFELQLVPRGRSRRGKDSGELAIGFFGSATRSYSIQQ